MSPPTRGLMLSLGVLLVACGDSNKANVPNDAPTSQDLAPSKDATAMDAAVDVAADVTPEAAPADVAPDVTPDVTSDDAPEAGVDAAPDVTPIDAPSHCASDVDCAGRSDGPRCDVASGRCVACLPDADNCASGSYCVPGMLRCEAGCRDDASCMSVADGGASASRCDVSTHRCVACVTDEHCPLGARCMANACAPGCSASRGCPTGLSCCADACVDTRVSTAACGACGRRCELPNAAPTCADGACAVGACTAPFGDCDGMASNGCETDTASAIAHCGRCGGLCAPQHGAPACAAGRCAVARCDEGFGDCDGDASNGCEVDLRASATHCGRCMNTCPASAASCVLSRCVPGLTVEVSRDLSVESLTPGRACAEAYAGGVMSLGAMSATLGAPPPDGCLAPGDLVLLINLQGAPGATGNVGNHELLTVASIDGAVVTFRAPRARRYGSGSGDDADIGGGVGQQRVVLQRVPVFGDVTVRAGATLTVSPWDGQRGGVFALRAARLTLDGAVSVLARGYRNGGFSVDDGSCNDSVATERGESIEGPPLVTTSASVGASGGLGAGGVSFHSNTPLSASAGHATAGEPGQNPTGRTLGAAGGFYGIDDGTRLTLGSGAGGNVTCRGGSFGPFLDTRSSVAGGIVALWAEAITVGAAGSIDANGADGGRTPGSGGYVLLRANTVSLGSGRVTARGSLGESVTSGGTVRNQGGAGYVTIYHRDPIVGTTLPAAFERTVSDPLAP